MTKPRPHDGRRRKKKNKKTYGRNLVGQLHVLDQRHRALLQRALEIDILDIVAQVCLLVDDADQAVLDLQVHLGAFFDIFAEQTARLDRERLATTAQN